jgi:hypothetical protein
MNRVVTLLISFAFVFANGPAVAMAMCHHNDARAHAAALQSADADVSSQAQTEERAANAAADQSTLTEAATILLAGFILPPEPASLPVGLIKSKSSPDASGLPLTSRSVAPLLEPPLS